MSKAKPTAPRQLLGGYLTVLGHPFSAEVVPQGDIPDDAGDCSWSEARIRVSEALPEHMQALVLCHEVMHAVDDVLGIGLRHVQIQSLAFAWLNLIRDNPHLIKYLTRDPLL